MPKRSNLAYSPKTAEEQHIKTVQKRKAASQAAAHRAQIKNTAMAVTYAVLLCSVLIYGKVKLTEVNQNLEATKVTQQETLSEKKRLESEMSKIVSLKNIQKAAQEQYQMVEVKPTQIVNIIISDDNKAVVLEKQSSISAKLSAWLDQIKEYVIG